MVSTGYLKLEDDDGAHEEKIEVYLDFEKKREEGGTIIAFFKPKNWSTTVIYSLYRW